MYVLTIEGEGLQNVLQSLLWLPRLLVAETEVVVGDVMTSEELERVAVQSCCCLVTGDLQLVAAPPKLYKTHSVEVGVRTVCKGTEWRRGLDLISSPNGTSSSSPI